MIIAIGNAPSSGSTFLADLLDATPITASGPELNLFGLRQLYDYEEFRNSPFADRSISVNKLSHQLLTPFLPGWGLDANAYVEMVKNAKTLEVFTRRLADHYLSLRGKSLNGVVFEKSPQNINGIKGYLHSYGNFFIHIVRNPVHVYRSLKKRQIHPQIALMNWMIDEAAVFKYVKHKKLLLIRYEDLIKSPFQVASDIIEKVSGIQFHASIVEENYHSSDYRRIHVARVPSWTVQESNKVVNANLSELSDEIVNEFSYIWNMGVSREYAQHMGIERVSFQEMTRYFGYHEMIDNLLSAKQKKRCLNLNFSAKKWLTQKWLNDVRNNNAKFSEFRIYRNPMEFIEH